ncbi:ABC transporter substrate-binding protein [Devosia sp.]|uniref:ABC transporter substrate-binding protein n=1 Tax=Devosia sp. TaxID=1871048 RepID=UPI003A599C4F
MRRFATAVLAATALASAGQSVNAETLRMAVHEPDAMRAIEQTLDQLEAAAGVEIELVEYPTPRSDYLTKLLTELAAGNAPDIFSVPGTVADLAEAGYLLPITQEFEAWDGYAHMFDVAKELALSPDGEVYIVPTMLGIQQIYYRRDILDAAGISTEQPRNWDELLERAREIKEKTGKYALLFPAGVSWGQGAFNEGFQHLIVGSSTPELSTDDGKLDLRSDGVREVFEFYKALIDEDLMPIQPLLGPEPWVIPKYEMYPAGELVATTCGSWCYRRDWGPESRNPIPNITEAVGTWTIPGKTDGEYVMAGLSYAWAVNPRSLDPEAATKVILEMASVNSEVAAAVEIGLIPTRMDAGEDPMFQEQTELVPIHKAVENGTFLKQNSGFAAVAEGVARATEALLRKETDAVGAQNILVDYVINIMGDDYVK